MNHKPIFQVTCIQNLKFKKMIRQIFLVALFGYAFCTPSEKIEKKLLDTISNGGVTNVVVSFADTKEVLSRVQGIEFSTREAKIQSMKNELMSFAAETQENAVHILDSKKIHFKSFWINNKIFIPNATQEIINEIAELPEVREVRQEIVLDIMNPVVEKTDNHSVSALDWNLEKIQLSQAWADGKNGSGVVVGIIDTGVRATHEALKNNYRQSYGWYDPYTSTSTPSDGQGHGTHVAGSIVGAGIGVAPGAQFIMCRGCGTSSCSELGLVECGAWILCPTLPNGESEDCKMAPAISSNSWGGGQGSDWYDPVISAWQEAGIIPVFAIGNEGPGCSTASTPGDRPNVIGVGSTNSSDMISYFSNRGPTVDKKIIKPDISAPGHDIRSASYRADNLYATMSGTSMATPHVSGVIAILLSHNPSLKYEDIKKLIQDNADRDLPSANSCGGTNYNTFPNNIYGYGRINVHRTIYGNDSWRNTSNPLIYYISAFIYVIVHYFKN